MTAHTLSLYAQQHHAQIAQGVALLLGFVASHVTAWLTHCNAPARVKAAVALVSATLAGVIASVGWSPGQPWYDWIKAIAFAIIASHATFALRAVTGVEKSQQIGMSLGVPDGAETATPGASDGSDASEGAGPVPDVPEVPAPELTAGTTAPKKTTRARKATS